MHKTELSDGQIIKIAQDTLITEANAIAQLAEWVDEAFPKGARMLLNMEGRAIITGIGKSAIIAQKIVATLNSTGTPAVFMHAADAIHGDLGIIQPHDVAICLSKSGNTPEIKVLVPLIRMQKIPLIAIVSNTESYLARHADLILRATVDQEACPNNLAPTSSTTAQVAIGDALAVCLLKLRGFTPQDFAKFHPGGALGKRLYLRVDDIIDRNVRPTVKPSDPIEKVVIEISSNRLGATAVIDEGGQIIGIITDGDLRRMLEKTHVFTDQKAEAIMSKNPKTIKADRLAINAFNLMESNKITQLIVTENEQYAGMIHLHDLLQYGIVG